jgi:hypothetical protein
MIFLKNYMPALNGSIQPWLKLKQVSYLLQRYHNGGKTGVMLNALKLTRLPSDSLRHA